MLFFLIRLCMARLIVEELETLRTVEQKIPKPKCLNYDRMTKYGYLEVPNGAVSFIYYSGESDKNLVFINGGPGMSSQVQNFLEVGPFAQRWNQFSNLLFLDLPAGTGYGRTNATAPLSYESVAIDYEYAMKGFINLCNITYNDVVLFSTDFGARFALSIASRVKLKSLALLDPFVDTLSIIAEIPTYAFHFGVIDGQELQYFERAIIQLSEKIYVGDYRYENGYFLEKLYYSTGNVSLYNVLSQKQYHVDEDILENALNDPDSFYYIPFETEFVARSKVVFDLFRDVYFEPKSDRYTILTNEFREIVESHECTDLSIII